MMSMTNNSNIKIKRTSATSASSGSKEAAITTTTMTKPIKSSTTTKSSFRLKLSIPKSMKKKKEKKQSNNGVAAVVTGNEYKIQNVAVISPKSLTTIPSSEDVDDHNHHETTTTGSSNNDASTTARSNDDVKVEGDEFNLADDQSLLLETDDNDEDVQSMAEWSGQIKMTDDDDDTCVSGSSESILSSSVQQKRGSIQLRPKKRGSKLLPPSMNDDDDDDDEDNEFLMLHDELHSSRHGDPEHKKKSNDKENNDTVQPRYEMMGDVYVRSDSALSISSSSNKNSNKPTTANNNHQTDLIKSKLNILTSAAGTAATTAEMKSATMKDHSNDDDDEQSGMRTPSIATQSEAGDDNVEEEVHIEGETPVRHKGIQVHDDEDDHLLNTSLRGQMFTIEGLRQQANKTKDAKLPQSLEMNITNSDETEAVQPTTNITTTSTIRMKILLLSPEHRKFELIKVKCTQDTSVDDVLTKLIPTTTSDPLFNKTLTYKSLCRVTSLSKNLGSSPSCASKSSSHSRGSKENNTSPSGSCSMEVFVNAFPLEVYDIRSKHYLIAIPSDDKWSVGDVADMGYAILQQAKQAKKQDRLLGAVGSPDSRSSGGSGQKSLNLSSTDIMAPIDEMTTLTEEKIVPTTILETSSVTDVVATTKTTTTSFWSHLVKFVLKMIGIWCLCMSFVALVAEDLRLRTPLGVGDVMEVGELKNKCGLLDIFLPTNTLQQMLGIELCPEGPSATLELVTYQSEGEMTNMALIYYEDSKPIWEMIPSSTSSSSSSWFKHSTKSIVSSDDTSTLTIDPKGHVWMGGSPAKLVLQTNKGSKHSSAKNNIRLSPWPFEQEPIGLAMH